MRDGDRAEKLGQIGRLTAHSILHSSESLCHILEYLARQALDHPGVPLKEYQIATEVLRRPPDFDPRVDSTVRVQTSRLRAKLAEYYSGPGAGDRMVVEIPKGSYILRFRQRQPAVVRNGPPVLLRPQLVLPVLAVVGVLAWALTPYGRQSPVLSTFWRPFLEARDEPLVIFSNAEFTGRPERGMRYFNPAVDSRETILDHYTGVGEVMAIHELDTVFASFRRTFRVKRGRLLTWDDAENRNLIFIGSPSENLSLRELPAPRHFVFRLKENEPRRGDLAIVNLNPHPGEPPLFLASASLPVTEDYALVALVPGLYARNRTLILAGTTTFGTQAAVEFVGRPASVEELLARLGRRAVDNFEAVLRVRISGGVPVQAEMVALRGN